MIAFFRQELLPMPYNIPIRALTQFLNSPATGYIQDSVGGTGYDDAADDAEDFFVDIDENVVDRPEEGKLHEHYKMEKKDSRHRMGDLMTAAEASYDDARAGKRSDEYNPKGQSFLPWLDGVPEWPRVVMWKGDVAFDTRKLQTAFSGLGFAIWVLSPKDRFYASSHKAEFIDAYRVNRNSWVGWSGSGCAGHQRLKWAFWDK